MKKRTKYFKFVELDKNMIALFLEHHPKMKKFIDGSKPFYCRIGVKKYPTLLHHAMFDGVDDKTGRRIVANLAAAVKTVKPKYINEIPYAHLIELCGEHKANLVRRITTDVLEKRINLRKLAKGETITMINELSYLKLSLDALKQYAIFGCFKQDVLCCENPDFIKGLKIYLGKNTITKKEIADIKYEYETQLTLFSLCMWRIVNERK